ncbi:hypothetical protein R1sor_015764 [Riccia sorocarpa]|uniref:Uncharacterized protein n=1 Tax=Riccia sorocarpa TaxID=122646 RepID=A0ABD3HGI3_9MARC
MTGKLVHAGRAPKKKGNSEGARSGPSKSRNRSSRSISEFESLKVLQGPEKRRTLGEMNYNGCRLAESNDSFLDLEDDNPRERKLRDDGLSQVIAQRLQIEATKSGKENRERIIPRRGTRRLQGTVGNTKWQRRKTLEAICDGHRPIGWVF